VASQTLRRPRRPISLQPDALSLQPSRDDRVDRVQRPRFHHVPMHSICLFDVDHSLDVGPPLAPMVRSRLLLVARGNEQDIAPEHSRLEIAVNLVHNQEPAEPWFENMAASSRTDGQPT
jgi:hypothetical protein